MAKPNSHFARWTQDSIDELKRLHADGRSNKVIAKALGRTFAAVNKKISMISIASTASPTPKASTKVIASTKAKPVPMLQDFIAVIEKHKISATIEVVNGTVNSIHCK